MPFNRAPADIARSAAESENPDLWEGLGVAMPFSERAGLPRNYAPTAQPSAGAGSWVIAPSGPAFDISTGIEFADAPWNRVPPPISIVVRYDDLGIATDEVVGKRGGTVGWEMRPGDGGSNNLTMNLEDGSFSTQVSVGDGGGPRTFGATFNESANDVRLFYDGKRVASGSTNSTPVEIPNEPLTLDAFANGLRYMSLLVWFGRRISDGDMTRLTVDPYAPFRRRRTFVPISVGGADITGSGSPQAGDATAIGTGERAITGTTTVQAQNVTVTGTGKRVITDQSSTVQAQPATASGSGTVGDAITGSGSAQAQDATATATGDRKIAGQGAPQAQAATATGVGERIITGAAAVQADPANASGTDTEEAFKAKLQPGVGYSRLYSYIKG